MKLAAFSALLLLALVSSVPISDRPGREHMITGDFFKDNFTIYEGQRDIVKIYIPMNNLYLRDAEKNIFIIEANEKDGKRVDEQLFLLQGNITKKLLDNARDVATPHDDSYVAYFAAKDGLYAYNNETKTAERYGQVRSDLVAVVCGNSREALYVLSPEKAFFKADDNRQWPIKDVFNAEQVVMDVHNNIYFFDSKDIYIKSNEGVKKVFGLPHNGNLTLLATPCGTGNEGGIKVIANKVIYSVYSYGNVYIGRHNNNASITAYAIDRFYDVHYFGYKKKVYAFPTSVLDKLYRATSKKRLPVHRIE